MELTKLMERAAKIGLLIERVHPGREVKAHEPYELRDARDYYGNDYLYGASLDEVAEELTKLEARRAEEKAAGIDKLHKRATKLGLLLKDTEEPDKNLSQEWRGPYVLTNLEPTNGRGPGYYQAHLPGVSLKFIDEQLSQIEGEGPGGP